MLVRNQYKNHGDWILKRLMLRLEKEMRALNNKDAPDPNTMEHSQKLRLFGGCLDPRALLEERRWNRSS